MPFKDHRDFIETLRKTGDLIEVTKEVDWDLEAGAIGRKMYEMGGPRSGLRMLRIILKVIPSTMALWAHGVG